MGGKPRHGAPPVVEAILQILQRTWEHARCELDFDDAYQLTVATILSAQCTDKMVNQVTPGLFKAYPNANRLAAAPLSRIETLIHRTGFFRQKAKSLRAVAQAVSNEHGGEVPEAMEVLTALPGVGLFVSHNLFCFRVP